MAVPPRIAQWLTELERAATRWHLPDALLLGAHLDVESEGGESKELDAKGPGGTGDHNPRRGKRYRDSARYRVVGKDNTDGAPLYLPADGRGWGRGLMQVDYAWHPDFCDRRAWDGRFSWEVPELNIAYGALVWAQNFATLRDVEATVCAYNAGAGAAQQALRELTRPLTPQRKEAALNAVTAPPCHYVTVVLDRWNDFKGTPRVA